MGMKYIITSILCVAALSASAKDITATLYCDTPETLIPGIMQKYGEEITMTMDTPAEKTTTVLLFNKKTLTWSLLLVQAETNLACVIGSGNGIRVKANSIKNINL